MDINFGCSAVRNTNCHAIYYHYQTGGPGKNAIIFQKSTTFTEDFIKLYNSLKVWYFYYHQILKHFYHTISFFLKKIPC